MSFSYGSTGNPPTTTSGLGLPPSSVPTTGSSAQPGGFSFNLQTSGAASGDKATGSLFSSTFKPMAGAAPTTSAGLGFNLSQPAKTSASTFISTSSAAPAGQTMLGNVQSSAQPNLGTGGGLSFGLGAGAISKVPATSAPTLSFGFGGATSVASTSAPISFTPILGSTAASTAPTSGLTFASPVTTTSSSLKLSLGIPTTSATTVTSTTGFSLGGAAVTSTVAPTLATTTSSSAPTVQSITFGQLEDSINKWTIDLEEQGKFFVNQAKQLNAWDSLLISNGEKILNLNGSIERVKQQQSQLDQELDFILAQQKELEELIVPLEKELVDVPVTDIDRNQMYQFAEIIDSQLKQISDDLKEIIENINESNKDEEESNPVSQISKILNAHMDSLQWIDRNTAQISRQLEEISKIEESNRINLSLNNNLSMFQ